MNSMILKHKKIGQQQIVIKDKMTGYDKTILKKTFILPNGLTELFFINEDRNSVCVLPITEDNKIIAIKQFRAGPEEVQLELPGGGLESAEDPLEAAMRELKEETGFSTEEMEHLFSAPYNPYSTGTRHCYLAKNCKKVSGKDLDPNEFLTVVLIDLDKFKELIRTASIRGFELGYVGLEKIGML